MPSKVPNPDVIELQHYNRDGCSHARVPGVATREEREAMQVDGIGIAKGCVAVFCPDCKELVPARITAQ